MDLNVLQVRLMARLEKKKFLLVLDDVWDENYIDWDVFGLPFITAAKGSKIIVTTRNESVRSIVRTDHTHYVKKLPDEACWTLFAKRAFEHENPSAYPKLEAIGKKIVEKCKGLPLAIKTLGGLLYSKVEEREWVSILNSEIWDLPNSKNNILPALRLCYYYLPSHLKRCFAYCSIFPKGNEFEKEQLVLLWLAGGFVESTKSNKSSEEIGDEYFQELVSRSFFQRSSRKKSLFVMHDLVNDFAQSVSREFCVKVDDGKSLVVSGKARHLGYDRENSDVAFKFSGAIQKAKYLQTVLPSRLSPSRASYPHSLNELPPNMRKLINLRHLNFDATKLGEMPIEFGRLKSLQTLNIFVVSSDCGSTISELGELSHLHGSLTILKLQNVIFSSDALEAKLNNKEYLEELVFKWDIVPDGLQNVKDVLDKLRPHENLKRLTINCSSGRTFPEWLGDASFSNIVSLHLQHCESCVSLPPVCRLASLTELLIEGMKGILSVGPEFYDRGSSSMKPFESLEILKLQDMSNLVLFSFGSHEGGEFPSLRELYIKECSKLTGNLPGHHLTSLPKLELNRCDALQSLPAEGLPTSLSSLSICRSSLLTARCQRDTGRLAQDLSHPQNKY